MDSINFDWLENDKAIIESLVASSTAPPTEGSNASNDILQYLLQTDNNTTTALPNMTSSNSFVQPLQQQKPNDNHVTERPMVSSSAATEFRSTVSVVQSKDNFVTFMPLNAPTKKSATPKKAKFKEPIFVTESPQNAYKKKKKPGNNNNSQLSHSSGDDNSDDDMMLDEELASSTSPSKLKQMTSKERRQLRNKISARNFRVRRKEYIIQLEEKVEEHEKTIKDLKDENSKLRSANEEIMKQLLNQPITPPSSSPDELNSSSSSSGSEGHHSPEALAVPSMFQFQLNDLYDFNLFDQQQQQQQQPQQNMVGPNNLFYLNHAVMPDWDIHQVLGEKGRPITSEEAQQEVSRELLADYPLLAPALMSIVLRHTLSLEYVNSLAKEFSETVGADLIEKNDPPAYSEDGYKTKMSPKIEHSTQGDSEVVEDKEVEKEGTTGDAIAQRMLNEHFPYYVLMRARGFSHSEVIERCRRCLEDENSKYNIKKAKKEAKKKAKEAHNNKQPPTLSTLHIYCRVAGALLKNPQRMTQVNKVLKEEISFTHNKHTARIENNYASLINPFKNLRITNTSK